MLQPIFGTSLRTFTGYRTSSSLLPSLLGTSIEQQILQRTSTSLIGNILDSNSRSQIMYRSSTSLLGLFLESVLGVKGGGKPTAYVFSITSLLNNLITSITKTLTINRVTSTCLLGVLTSNYRQTNLFRSTRDMPSFFSSVVAYRTGSWVVYIGCMLGNIIDSSTVIKFVIAGTTNLSDMTVAAIIGAMFAGVSVFALMFVRRKRQEEDNSQKEYP